MTRTAQETRRSRLRKKSEAAHPGGGRHHPRGGRPLHRAKPISCGWQPLPVLRAIKHCRTAALGRHLDQCSRCGHRAISFFSCPNRHCPKCQSAITSTGTEKCVGAGVTRSGFGNISVRRSVCRGTVGRIPIRGSAPFSRRNRPHNRHFIGSRGASRVASGAPEANNGVGLCTTVAS